MAVVSLLIDDQVFKANKEDLCKNSDYFRAMFSGHYVENDKEEISIEVVDAESMRIILQYMNSGLIDPTEFTLPTMEGLIISAHFLQITELIKQLENTLDSRISPSSCLPIMVVAQNSGLTKIESLAATCALLSFKCMKPEYTPNISNLCWYLSHPYLDASCELDVFNFGHEWLLQNETGADALLLVLGCLDVKRLTLTDLEAIKTCMSDYPNSLAAKVVDCLHSLAVLEFGLPLSVTSVQTQKYMLRLSYTERVYDEVINLVKQSKTRLPVSLTPAVHVFNDKDEKSSIYRCKEGIGFEKWFEIAEKYLWGWNAACWGPTRVVVVGGQLKKGSVTYVRDVNVYDTLRNKWTEHGVKLPARSFGGVAIVGDKLFIAGGEVTPRFLKWDNKRRLCSPSRHNASCTRIKLDTCIVYDLEKRSYKTIALLPHPMEDPIMCEHEGNIYIACCGKIYKYEDQGNQDRWSMVLDTDKTLPYTTCMTSFQGYIYCVHGEFNHLYRFKPGVNTNLELVIRLSRRLTHICDLGDRLLLFFQYKDRVAHTLTLQEYTGNITEGLKILWQDRWSKNVPRVRPMIVVGAMALLPTELPLFPDTSNYTKKYLKTYEFRK